MSTIVIPNAAQWQVLVDLGLVGSGSFLIVNPEEAVQLREQRGLDLRHGQSVEFSTGLGEDDIFIAFVAADNPIGDALVEEINGADGADPIDLAAFAAAE